MSFAMLAENPRAPLNAFLHRKMAVAPVMDRGIHHGMYVYGPTNPFARKKLDNY